MLAVVMALVGRVRAAQTGLDMGMRAATPACVFAAVVGIVSPVNQPPFAALIAFGGVAALRLLWLFVRSNAVAD